LSYIIGACGWINPRAKFLELGPLGSHKVSACGCHASMLQEFPSIWGPA